MLPLLLGCLATASAGGLARLEAFMDRMRSLEASFRQTVYDESARKVDEASGKLYLQRPGRFRWDYVEPYRQEIVGDGDKVWIYDADLQQVTVRAFDEALGDTPASLLSSDAPLAERFEMTDVDGPDGLEWVALKPKAGEGGQGAQTSYADIRLGFEGDVLRAMELEDNFGQTTRLDFIDVERNPELDDALFRFEPPPGADVIGG